MKLMTALGVVVAIINLCPEGNAADVEYDVCSCKTVQIGAQSTLHNGVCQRTEAGSCLMQWGALSNQKVPSGSGTSQQDAAIKAEGLIRQGVHGDFKVQALIPAPPGVSSLQIAIANLARTPPDGYNQPGVVESFVLAASTALARFDLPIPVLAQSLLGKQRGQLIDALRSEGSFSVESFVVQGRTGCLQVDAMSLHVHVYIKTPFATSESC
jgi:hypothetical protein